MVYTAHDMRKLYDYMSDGEIDALARCVRTLPTNPVVINIGAGAGVSGLAIFQAREDVMLWTVDINWQSPLGCLDGENDAFKKAGIDKDHPRHKQVLGDSRRVAAQWKFGEADLIFVDDGHHRADVEGDIDGWLPHLKDGGIMAFHDYGSPNWPDVKAVVDEKMSRQSAVEYADTMIAFKVEK